MDNASHPLILFDYIHVNTPEVVNHFHQFLKPCDYIIVEDVNPNSPAWEIFFDKNCGYNRFGPKNLYEMEEFLTKHIADCAVDSFYCDYYRDICTWNWNG